MDINTLQPEKFVDLFPEAKNQGGITAPKFGLQNNDVDLFGKSITDTTTSASATDTTTVATSLTDTTTVSQSLTDTTTLATDILSDDDAKKAGRKPKYDFTDASGYFADRFKSGKLVAIKETKEDGSEIDFVPKTPEEFDEVIDMQVNYRLQQKTKEIEQKLYQTKSPAWQVALRYSELVDDPAEMIPFISGVKTIESISQLDENTPEGAEKIIRTRLLQKGDPEEVIQQNIDILKSSDKLIPTAKQYKPLILQEETNFLKQSTEQKRVEEADYNRMIAEVEQQAIKTIESPMFGKQKLKRDEQAAIYDLIAYPSETSQGYAIYSAIDKLFENKDFNTLAQIALFVAKKDAFLGYISNSAATNTAAGLQKKLRFATDSNSSGNDDIIDENKPVIRRTYTGRLGRG